MSAYRYEQERVVVAITKTAADAELIKITLAAHGYEAFVSAASVVYPSIDFVEGMRVQVPTSDEAAVRALLEKLRLVPEPDADDKRTGEDA